MKITNPQLAYSGEAETVCRCVDAAIEEGRVAELRDELLSVEVAVREGRIAELRDELDFLDNLRMEARRLGGSCPAPRAPGRASAFFK